MLKGTSTCWSTWLFQAKYLGMKCTKDLLQRCGPTRLELNVPFVKKVDLLRRSRKKTKTTEIRGIKVLGVGPWGIFDQTSLWNLQNHFAFFKSVKMRG